MIQEAIRQVITGGDLHPDQAYAVMGEIAGGKATEAQIGCFLTALRMKGETATEIASFARVMQQCQVSVEPRVSGMMVDTCGTGGDHTGAGNTFNISTAAAIVAAAAGVLVMKHGNRSVSSRCGSADVLEALGVTLDQTPVQAARTIEKTGMGFLFAPLYHPAMRHVAPVRKEIGIYTVFNILGPLLNPARAQGRLIGVYDPALVPVVAEALRELGVSRAMVVHGDGLDEITTTGETRIAELRNNDLIYQTLKPEDFGIIRARIDELYGGNPEENAGIIRRAFAGGTGPHQDIVALNAGAAIYLSGHANDLKEGVTRAFDVIQSGAALKKLDDIISISGGPV